MSIFMSLTSVVPVLGFAHTADTTYINRLQ